MKPKPFASLNHFTVPVVRAMLGTPQNVVVSSEYRNKAVRTDPQLLVITLTMGTPRGPTATPGDGTSKKRPCVSEASIYTSETVYPIVHIRRSSKLTNKQWKCNGHFS